jgi:hypothetical protein
MKPLDWKKLLGFEQVAADRDRRALTTSRIGGKIGDKQCQMIRGLKSE